MKKLFFLLAALWMTAAGTVKAEGNEIYALFNSVDKTCTIYYDDQRESRGGVLNWPTMAVQETKEMVQKVVFDESMKEAKPESTMSWFEKFKNLEEFENLTYLNTSEVKDMSWMFFNCESLKSLDLRSFDTRKVTNMSSMFDCKSLTSLDVSSFNTSNVTNMFGMFGYCYDLTSLDLKSFNTEKVTDMGWMFAGCTSLKSLDLSSFVTSNVTNMDAMFYNCLLLTTIYCNGDWSKGKVTTSESMFSGCEALKGGNGTAYDEAHVDINYARLDGLNDQPGYFTKCKEIYAVLESGKTTLTIYYDDQRYERGGVTDWSVYNHISSDKKEAYDVTKVVFTESIKDAKPRSTAQWFADYSKLKSIEHLDWLNTSEVIDMSEMFGWCASLTSLDLSKFDTHAVTDMSHMFVSCSSLASLDVSSFVTSNVTNMDGMFAACHALTTLDLSNFDTQKVTRMSSMFSGCDALTSIDVSKLDTRNVVYMEYMFSECASLTELDVSNFDVKSVYNMEGLFNECKQLTELDLSTWTTVITASTSKMFKFCEKIKEVNIDGFNAGPVKFTDEMFFRCIALTTIYCRSDWSTGIVENSDDMFRCSKLVGGKGTKWNSDYKDITYARLDGGTEKPGYFTDPTIVYYTVTFVDMNGDPIGVPQKVEEGTAAVAPEAPVVEGYSFTSWDKDFSNVTGDMTIQAQYKLTQFTVTFVGLGGADLGSQVVKDGESAVAPEVPETEGFYFKGWDQDFSNVTSDLTVQALFIDLAKAETTLYALLDGTELTIRYDKLFEAFDKAASLEDIESETKEAVTKVVFDESVKDYEVTSLSNLCANMYQLTAVEGLKNINVTSLEDVSFLFQNCTSLTEINLNGFDIKGVTAAYGMFQGCGELTTVFCDADYTNLAGMTSLGMFDGCNKIVGGEGTKWEKAHIDASYARPDRGVDKPGYFTATLLEKDSFLVSVVVDGLDAALVNITGAKKYGEGDPATLGFELLDEHYAFDMWTWDGNFRKTETVKLDGVTEDMELTLHFVPKNYTVTAVASPEEGGTVSGAGTAPYLSVITLTAVPAEGWQFDGWQDDNTAPAERSITVLGETTYTALFSKQTETGIDQTLFPSGETRGEASKLLRNGILYILVGDRLYDATGRRVE